METQVKQRKNNPDFHLFFDANILIFIDDYTSPFQREANDLLDLALRYDIPVSICSVSIIFYEYILRKHKSNKEIKQSISSFITVFNVLPVTKEIIIRANSLAVPDIEDAVQHESARLDKSITHIVTGDKKFPKIEIPVLSINQAFGLIKLYIKSKFT